MTDIMNDRYLHSKNKIIFFFRNYYSIFPAPLPMTDRYISIVNHHLLIMIIFIPATLKYFSSIILVLIKHYSCIQHYPILLTILPNCVGPILPPAPFQQCRRLNFCKENQDICDKFGVTYTRLICAWEGYI